MSKATLMLVSNLPKKHKNQTPYLGEISKQNAIDLFNISKRIDDYKNRICYVYGKTNTQKTTMISLLGLELINNNQSVKYITLCDLLNLLCTFELTEKQNAKISDIYECNFLFIDDFNGLIFNQLPYKTSNILFYNFIKNRYGINKKNIFFISRELPERNNLTLDIELYIKTQLRISQSENIKTLFEFRDDYLQLKLTNENLDEFYKIKKSIEETSKNNKK